MHGSRAENASLLDALLEAMGRKAQVECVVFPPFVYLAGVVRSVVDSAVRVGGQNCSTEAHGALTGEVSAAMLRDVGCSHVLVGHSERRALFGEADTVVARKFAAAQAAGLTPIMCVGESLAERDAGSTHQVVGRQLDAVLDLCGVRSLDSAMIAYEPVWAIGTGRNASPAQAQDVHVFIRDRIALRDAKIAGSVSILYGGSVKAANASALFAMPDVDGGLVGGASLKADEFVAILAAAAA